MWDGDGDGLSGEGRVGVPTNISGMAPPQCQGCRPCAGLQVRGSERARQWVCEAFGVRGGGCAKQCVCVGCNG